MELDESLAEAHVVLGAIQARDLDFQGAIRRLRKAAELNPGLEALVDDATGRRFTFGELDARADRTAHLLVGLGLKKGDRTYAYGVLHLPRRDDDPDAPVRQATDLGTVHR